MSSENKFDMHTILTKSRLVGLWRLLSGFRTLFLIAILCLGLAAAGKTATFYLIRFFIDDVLGDAGRSGLLPLIALGFVGLALAQGAFSFLSGRLAAQTSEGVIKRLRDFVYDHLQHLSFSYHDKTPTGELIQRCTSDVDAIRRLFAMQAVAVGRILFLFLINFGALLSLNVRLGLISVVVIPFVLVISYFFSKWISRTYEAYQEQEAKLSTTLQENLSGIRVVKAFGRWDFEKDKFEKENAEKFEKGKKLVVAHGLFWPITDLICGGQMLVGYALGAIMAMNGEISLGTYLAYTGMVVQIIWPMRMLGRIIVNMATGVVSFGRIAQVIKEKWEPLLEGGRRPEHLAGDIEFRNVSFEYDKDVPVLHDVSFRCRSGQIVALLGRPGSGKTTLVNLLPRFYEYTGGDVLVDGVSLKDYPRHVLRRFIGIVEQEPFLFSRTIRDNITYGVERDVPDEEVVRAARFAAVHDVIETFSQGYQTMVGEKGVTLSGGQKQRIAIARTLLKDPRILILDDSTSSVDMETEMIIREALQKLMQSRTTFIIAHRIQSLMRADLILVMDQGRIVQSGTHRELVDREGFYKQIYDMQSQIGVDVDVEKDARNVQL